jgi:hypothetical protein
MPMTKTYNLPLAYSLGVAAGCALVVAGCHVVPGTSVLSTVSDPAAAAANRDPEPAIAGKAPITRVLTPPGFGPVDLSRIQEVEGDSAIGGSVVGTDSVEINDAVLYFTSPDDKYYVARTKDNPSAAGLVAASTDATGRFKTAAVFPKDLPVVVSALLSRNRRLVGLGVAGSDDTKVNAGSTLIFEFFRDQVAARSLDAGALIGKPEMRATIFEQSARANQRILNATAADKAELDEFYIIGNGSVLAAEYVGNALADDPESAKAWLPTFPRLAALTTLAGTFHLRDTEVQNAVAVTVGLHGPTAVTQGPPGDDAVYIAERDGWHIQKVDPATGRLSHYAGKLNKADPTVASPRLSADETALNATDFSISQVHEIKADSKGNFAITLRSGSYPLHVVGFVCNAAGTYFGRTMAAGKLYYLTAPDGKEGFVDGGLAAGKPTGRFRDPHGLSFDDAGNLYVCDRRHNRVRRIDAASGAVETVLGDGWPFLTPPATGGSSWGESADALGGATSTLTPAQAGATGSSNVTVTDFGRLLDQANPASGSGLAASFNRPLQVEWRKEGDQQALYVYDSYNSVVRKATTAYPGGTFKDATVKTFAGTTKTYSGGRSYTVTIGDSGFADGLAASARFNFASYNPTTRSGAQVVAGGMGLDREHGILYVTDTNNLAIRGIDLGTGDVFTLAKHDPRFSEGDAQRVLLSSNLGGITVLRGGDVVFTDAANHVVRRIHSRHAFAP